MSANAELLLSQIVAEVQCLCPDVDCSELQVKMTGIIALYEIKPSLLQGAHPDAKEKIELFISSKKIEGASLVTILGYRRELRIFSKSTNKPVDQITTMDIRSYLGQFETLKEQHHCNEVVNYKNLFWLAYKRGTYHQRSQQTD